MARTKTPIDKDKFAQLIEALEASQTYESIAALCQAAAESEPGKLLGLTPSLVRLRIQEFGINLKTQPGKRGAHLQGRPQKPKVSDFDLETLKLAIHTYKQQGIEVTSFQDFLTCSYDDDSLNKQRRIAMIALRKALNVPAPPKHDPQR